MTAIDTWGDGGVVSSPPSPFNGPPCDLERLASDGRPQWMGPVTFPMTEVHGSMTVGWVSPAWGVVAARGVAERVWGE